MRTFLLALGMGVALNAAGQNKQGGISPEMLKCFSYAVLTNGSCVVDVSSGELIWSQKIGWLSLYRAMKKLEKLGGYGFLMQNGVIRATEEGERLVSSTMLKNMGKDDNIIGGYSGDGTRYRKVLEAVNPFAKPTYKVQVFFRDRESCSRALEELKDDKSLAILTMFGTTLEITAKGVTKAAALDVLCGKLGYEPGAYAAFGDSRNDLEMLQASAYAVAMENGEQCVKDIADYIAPPVSEDGAASAIYEIFKI